MPRQSNQRRCDLLERMNSSIELNTLLDLFGEEVESLGLVDGYLINLRDATGDNLISLKVRFTAEFRSLEETYLRYKISLKGDVQNVSARAFNKREIVQVNLGNGSEEEKKLLTLWKLKEITAIPMLEDKNTQDKPHSAGNVVLAGVAQEITKLVRKMDLACRYGGEEFVVILSKCDLEGIKTFSERLRLAIEGAGFETEAGRLSVTVSIGCTTHQPNDTNETIFKRADQALYRAKGSGRNRVEAT